MKWVPQTGSTEARSMAEIVPGSQVWVGPLVGPRYIGRVLLACGNEALVAWRDAGEARSEWLLRSGLTLIDPMIVNPCRLEKVGCTD